MQFVPRRNLPDILPDTDRRHPGHGETQGSCPVLLIASRGRGRELTRALETDRQTDRLTSPADGLARLAVVICVINDVFS